MRNLFKKSLGSLLIPLLLVLTNISHADFTVDSNEDKIDNNIGDGNCLANLDGGNTGCTLRAAIQEANVNSDKDIITLPDDTYTLSINGIDEEEASTGDLDITQDLEIRGANARTTIIDANKIDRVIHIMGNIEVTISGVTIQNGELATGGAGILNESGDLTIESCSILENINNAQAQSLINYGGGINNQGTLKVYNSTITNNRATNQLGGGIYDTGSLTVDNSTVSQNIAGGNGGGIWTRTGTITNSTITLNETGGSGGGIFGSSNGSVTDVEFGNSIIAGNTASSGGNDCTGIGAPTSLGYNLIGTNCGVTPNEGDEFGDFNDPNNPLDPLLGTLQDNGGPTNTHALLDGSPAINMGDPTNCPATDQRGLARPIGGTCDVGAFEFGCGDGTLDANEQCDDGNTVSGDGCSNLCLVESTGNGDTTNTGTGTGGCAINQLSASNSKPLTLALGLIVLGYFGLRRKRKAHS